MTPKSKNSIVTAIMNSWKEMTRQEQERPSWDLFVEGVLCSFRRVLSLSPFHLLLNEKGRGIKLLQVVSQEDEISTTCQQL